jgi:hypothetical protein
MLSVTVPDEKIPGNMDRLDVHAMRMAVEDGCSGRTALIAAGMKASGVDARQ